MKTLIISIFIFSSMYVLGQKKPLIEDSQEVMKAAMAELNLAMQAPEGSLYLFAVEHKITGTYIFDIQLYEKGKVASVFCKSRDEGDISSQNKLKDAVMDLRFHFKMPKGKKYKFSYTFSF